MSSILTSRDLIKSIQRRGFIPRDQATFTDEDFLAMATEEVNIGLMDQIIEARGDYLVYHVDFPLSSETSEFSIPSRAHGNKLRDAAIVDSNGNVVSELTQLSVEDLADQDNYYGSATPSYFYVQNDSLILGQELTSHQGNSLRMYFYMRPNKLVLNDRAAIVSSIADATEDINGIPTAVKVLSFATLPKHFTSELLYDSTKAISPNKILKWDLSPVTVNLTFKTISFLPESVVGIALGDYITKSEETIVPNVPTEYHPVIAQRVAVACMEAMGDEQNKQSAERKLAQMEKAVLKMVTNRVEGAPRKIKNRHGALMSGVNKIFRRW